MTTLDYAPAMWEGPLTVDTRRIDQLPIGWAGWVSSGHLRILHDRTMWLPAGGHALERPSPGANPLAISLRLWRLEDGLYLFREDLDELGELFAKDDEPIKFGPPVPIKGLL